MSTRCSDRLLSRRTALAGLAAGGAGAVLVPTVAARQASPDSVSTHPMVGIWLAMTPGGPTPAHFLPDGSFLASSSPISTDAEGTVTYLSPRTGAWEPDGERGIHFTTVQSMHDAAGVYTGTLTVDGYPVASEDGETFYDDGTRFRETYRDPDGTVTLVRGEDVPLPPTYGSRLRPGTPVFLTAPPVTATPAD